VPHERALDRVRAAVYARCRELRLDSRASHSTVASHPGERLCVRGPRRPGRATPPRCGGAPPGRPSRGEGRGDPKQLARCQSAFREARSSGPVSAIA
jgi:hypothetical protein